MQRGERRKILSSYIKFRLREECKVRGVAAHIARETGFSTAHLTNVTKEGFGEKGIGEDFAEAIAKYWGMSFGQLNDQATAWSTTSAGRAAVGIDRLIDAVRVPNPDRRAVAADLAREDGVLEAAIASVLEEPPSEHTALWWADRMRMRQLELMRGEHHAPPSSRAVPDESGATRRQKKTSRG